MYFVLLFLPVIFACDRCILHTSFITCEGAVVCPPPVNLTILGGCILTRNTTNFIYPNVVLRECDVASFKFLCRNALQIEEAGKKIHLCKGKRYFLQIYKKIFTECILNMGIWFVLSYENTPYISFLLHIHVVKPIGPITDLFIIYLSILPAKTSLCVTSWLTGYRHPVSIRDISSRFELFFSERNKNDNRQLMHRVFLQVKQNRYQRTTTSKPTPLSQA